MTDAKVGDRIPVSARWFEDEIEVDDVTALCVLYVEDQSGAGRRYIQANSLGSGLGVGEITFPLEDFVAGVGYALAGGWVIPTIVAGLEVVIEKRPSDLEHCDVRTERYSVAEEEVIPPPSGPADIEEAGSFPPQP